MRSFVVIFSLLLALGIATALENNRVLVLLGNRSIQQTHSKFFSSLQDRGYKLTFSTTENPSQYLTEYGVYLFDHLIVFAPHIDEFSGNIDVTSIVDFIDAGKNVLVAADAGVSPVIRELLAEVGVSFMDKSPSVLDHFTHDTSYGESHDVLIVSSQPELSPVLGASQIKNILFSGTNQILNSNRVSDGLLFPILSSLSTSYPSPRTTLVSGLQARNNARVVISGSLSLFSNKFMDSKIKSSASSSIKDIISGNKQFALALTSWNFGERSVLRTSRIKHARLGEAIAPAVYTINDNITVSVDIEELVDGKWVPFKTNDMMLEFIMLDPYVRLTLKPHDNGTHSITFKSPDVYGVYTFEIDYKKFGYSHIFLQERTPLGPYKHNQYERFLEMAYPYYAGAFSMIIGVVVLGLVILYQK